MPGIARVVPIPAPAQEPWERREYPSPGGAWTLVFRDPYDVRVGTAWAAQLWSGGRDVTLQHPALGVPGQKRFRAPDDLRPWAHDGRTLALMRGAQRPIQLYRPEERSLLELGPEVADPNTVQWAPALDRLLVATRAGGSLYDASGIHRGTARWTSPRWESPHIGWTGWGAVFVITRDPKTEGGTEIAFYDGADGGRTASLPLDPLELVPYDAARYAAVSRGRCSLVIGPNSYGSGTLLDTWARVRHDVETDALLLQIYRPTADPYAERGHLVCRAESRWVEVTLAR